MKNLKGFIIIFLIITVFSSGKENGFTIKVTLTGIREGTKMYLHNISADENIDSAIVVNSSFSFKGKLIDEPEELRIISDLKEPKFCYTDLLIGNEDVQVKGDASDFTFNAITTGSATQNEAQLYYRQMHKWNIRLASLKASLPANADSYQKQQLDVKLKGVRDSIEIWKINFIKQNFGTYFGMLSYNYRQDFPTDTLEKLFAKVPANLRRSKYGKAIAVQIAHPQLKPGDRYYDFGALSAVGGQFKFPNSNTKYTLLQFAGTGCYGSGLSVKNMKEINDRYKNMVSFVSYFIDTKKEIWLTTVATQGINWTSIWTPGGKYSEAYNTCGITGTPTFFIISPDHKVVSRWFGYEDGIIEKELAKVLEKKLNKVVPKVVATNSAVSN